MSRKKNVSQTDISELLPSGYKVGDNKSEKFNIDPIKFAAYDLDQYKKDVQENGLRQTWNEINCYTLNYGDGNDFLSADSFADLYEVGLALRDKQQKKESGQYYTPDDVASVMANWYKDLQGSNICDVACGTGKLILTYLNIIGKDAAVDLIKNGRLYLYDSDDVALSICKTIILLKYGRDLESYIHDIHCDFLSEKTVLPADCKVISNPPYSSVDIIPDDWQKTDVATATKEQYAVFMEKIIKQSRCSVIITPYSFIGGKKFYPLRKVMNDHNGFIVSFDNVPGNIFRGKKHGIFNSNTSNSVRAAITVFENKENGRGFKLSPLIRFKNEERRDLLKTDVLEDFIYDKYQIVTDKNPMYFKCHKQLGSIWETWQDRANKTLGDYVDRRGKHILSVASTCRYFTAASKGAMRRRGQILLNIDDDVFDYVFCLLNSSFAYWYWRLFDGGITYPKGLLLNLPVFYDLLSEDDKRFFKDTASEMIERASDYVVKKNNIGVQENIKYPREFRDRINRKLLDILGIETDEKKFDLIHSNRALASKG